MKINWKVRFKNPVFWRNIIISILAPMLTYLGVNANDLTTWSALINVFGQAISNPVIVVGVVCSVWNAIIDPTTEGSSDSLTALTYTVPKPHNK